MGDVKVSERCQISPEQQVRISMIHFPYGIVLLPKVND